MTKKYEINEIKNSFRLASSVTPIDLSQHKRDYEMAVKLYTEVIEEAEKLRINTLNTVSYQDWQKFLCMANFGLGFGKGLLDMKNKTYRGQNRHFCEIESIVTDFKNACSCIRVEPLATYNHLNLGESYGSLGLAKEGKNMLESSTYWDNIRAYIEKGNIPK